MITCTNVSSSVVMVNIVCIKWIGDGKTCIRERLAGNGFITEHYPTIESTLCTKEWKILPDNKIRL